MNWIWSTYQILAGLPFIPFIIVFVIAAWRGMERNRAIRLAMDVTNLFLIGIVSALLNSQSGSKFGFYFIVLVMLIGAGLIGNAQTRLRGKINPPKIFRAVWRLSFFAMVLLYVVLISLELVLPSGNGS
jgi:hypothetical protein